jgi:uncharacterized repeat protein (TIGR04042 family)
MPEMHFKIEWPNGVVEDCYSPSYVIEDHLTVGATYAVEDFVARARTALTIASERVLAKYGYECSSALDQLRALEERAANLPAAALRDPVKVLAFDKHAPRDARRSGT